MRPRGAGSTLLVVNPRATKVVADVRARATRILAAVGLLDVVVTREKGYARRRILEAVEEGVRTVASLGGDGVLAEVADTLAGSDVTVIPLPGGGTNVFARAVGWPSSLDRALAVLPAALATGRTAHLRLGRIDAGPHSRVFMMNTGVGLDAETVHWVEGHTGLKRRLRQGSFILGAWRVGLRYARRPPRIDISVDGRDPIAAAAVVATCGRPYTFLGTRPLDLVPGAAFDGAIAWRALTRVSVAEVARVAISSAAGGDPGDDSALIGGVAMRSLTVSADPVTAVQADGEPLGWHRRIDIAPGPSVCVLLPPGPARTIGAKVDA